MGSANKLTIDELRQRISNGPPRYGTYRVQENNGTLYIGIPAQYADTHSITKGDELQTIVDPELGIIAYEPKGGYTMTNYECPNCGIGFNDLDDGSCPACGHDFQNNDDEDDVDISYEHPMVEEES